MAKLLVSLVLAGWGVAIALLSVQNATPVALRLFGLRSIELPFGLVLALTAAVGLVGTTLLLPLGRGAGRPAGRR